MIDAKRGIITTAQQDEQNAKTKLYIALGFGMFFLIGIGIFVYYKLHKRTDLPVAEPYIRAKSF